MRKKITLLLFL